MMLSHRISIYKSSSAIPSISNTAKQARRKLAANVPRASLRVIDVFGLLQSVPIEPLE